MRPVWLPSALLCFAATEIAASEEPPAGAQAPRRTCRKPAACPGYGPLKRTVPRPETS